jgi:transcriptional regulator with XRE-family HTH domain
MRTGRPSQKPRTDFGSRLLELREKRALSQAEVARHLGISPRAYAFWEREPVALRPEQIATLARVFGVSVDSMIEQTDCPQAACKPVGRMQQLFDEASQLPRRQQQKIIDILEPFIRQFAENK